MLRIRGGYWAVCVGAALAVAACGGDDDSANGTGGNGGAGGAAGGAGTGGAAGAGNDALMIPCDVQAVLTAKCQRCHGDPQVNGAPFALLTLEDFHVDYFGMLVHEWAVDAVESGRMPYPSTTIMPPVEPLTDTEKALLLGWLEQGAVGVPGDSCP